MSQRARTGDWVQVENTVLSPGERAPGVPEETQAVPLKMRVKGFALGEGNLGDEIEIQTIIGRKTRGRLVDLDPAYQHTFGKPVKELLTVGPEVRKLIRQREATGRGGPS